MDIVGLLMVDNSVMDHRCRKDHSAGRFDSYCMIESGRAEGDIGVDLVRVGKDVRRSVALLDVKVAETFAKVVHNHCTPHVGRSSPEGGSVMDIRQVPSYCSKGPHYDLYDRMLQRYLLLPQEIHVLEELDYNIDHSDENEVGVAVSSHEVEMPHCHLLDGLHREGKTRYYFRVVLPDHAAVLFHQLVLHP